MNAIFLHLRATDPLFTDRGEHGRAALNGCALKIVLHSAQAAQLFAAARTSRTTVHQLRQR